MEVNIVTFSDPKPNVRGKKILSHIDCVACTGEYEKIAQSKLRILKFLKRS